MRLQWMFLLYQWNEPTEASFKLQSTEQLLIAVRWRILWKPCTIGILESYHIQYSSWRYTLYHHWKFLWSTYPASGVPLMSGPKLGIVWCVCNGILVAPLDHYDTNISNFPCQTMPCATFRPQFPKDSNKVQHIQKAMELSKTSSHV